MDPVEGTVTVIVIALLAALILTVLLPFILLHEWPLFRRARDYSPYRRDIPITHTEGRVVDLVGVKPTKKAS